MKRYESVQPVVGKKFVTRSNRVVHIKKTINGGWFYGSEAGDSWDKDGKHYHGSHDDLVKMLD